MTEAKKIVAEKFKNDIETTPIMPRGAFPPDVGTSGHLLVLAGGGSYKSHAVTGVLDAKWAKALFDMSAFVLVPGGDSKIRKMQQEM
ncbi:hypothetical protein EfmAA96_31900 (plasmid) [Enterococcus faecium]|nr:hypothetical protein EfmAA96_31900 [Enterococcus faecium]